MVTHQEVKARAACLPLGTGTSQPAFSRHLCVMACGHQAGSQTPMAEPGMRRSVPSWGDGVRGAGGATTTATVGVAARHHPPHRLAWRLSDRLCSQGFESSRPASSSPFNVSLSLSSIQTFLFPSAVLDSQ